MKRFLVMVDIEGVTGVTTFKQAEGSELGWNMLMHDIKAVLAGIKAAGAEAVLYDMHTDGRNVDLNEIDAPVIMGKPICGEKYKSVGGHFDGLYMLGLHTMMHVPGALLQHSYMLYYDEIRVNGLLVGEIGMEALLAGEQGIPLRFVSGDDLGCKEATDLIPNVTTCAVKTSLGDDTALCLPPCVTGPALEKAAFAAASNHAAPFKLEAPYEITVKFADGPEAGLMYQLHPEIFHGERTVVLRGESLLKTWAEYLTYEKQLNEARKKA